MDRKESLRKIRTRVIGFRSELDREIETVIMKSDRVRSSLLGTVFFAITGFVLVLAVFFPGALRYFTGERYNPFLLAGAAFMFGLYELGYRTLVGLFMKRGLKFPLPPRYGNAFIELALPTLVLYAISLAFEPAVALSTPVVMAYMLIIAFSILRLDAALSIVSGMFGALQYLLLAGYLGLLHIKPGYSSPLELPYIHVSRAFFIVISGIVASFIAYQVNVRLVSFIRSRDERNRISAIFGQHVSPAVMEKLLEKNEEVMSEMRYVCVMFLDIRDFTSFSQKREPETVVEYLNRVFDFMIDIVNANGGIINKFLGDGFMAVFGAPVSGGEDARNAVNASLQIIRRLEEEVESGRIVPTRIGIGLHAGEVITGNVGSSARREYTVIGDVVNLASRIEQLNKQFGSSLLVSASVMESAGPGFPGLAGARPLGPVAVKGRDEQVEVFQVG